MTSNHCQEKPVDFGLRSRCYPHCLGIEPCPRSHDLGESDRHVEPTRADGVAEAILRGVDPELLERVKSRLTEAETSEPPVEKKQEQVKQTEHLPLSRLNLPSR